MALPEKCPLCEAGRDAQSVVTAHVYGDSAVSGRAFFHCEACDVRYLHPPLGPEEEARFYTEEFTAFMAGRAGGKGGWEKADDHIRANESARLRRMKYLDPLLEKGMRVLEIGCSSGFMLYPLVDRGFDCTGVEPSGVFGASLRARRVPVFDSLEAVLQMSPRPAFDLIMHFFVLEHIADPESFLKSQLALLKPGGRIVIEIPNAADPLHSIYDIPAFERFYWSIAHHWYFGERSLSHLLDRLGAPYSLLRDQRYDLSNHMVWARDGRPGGMGRFTAMLGTELEEMYKQALVKIGYCDTLIGIIETEGNRT